MQVEVVHEIVAHAAHAATLTSLIEKVGSYAGFAAIVGLAVLSALYFSQARDVRRLRDWAGRAPERSAEVQAGGRTPEAAAVRTGQPPSRTVGPAQPVGQPPQTGAQPVRPAPGAAPKPAATPAGAVAAGAVAANAPAPARAAAGAGAPAAAPAAGAGAATPAGAAASAAGAAPATASAGTATAPKPPPATPGAGAPSQGADPATGGHPPQGGGTLAPPRGAPPSPTHPGTGAKVLPARPVQPRPRPITAPAGSGSTAVIPPPSQRGRRWTAPRYLALIVAGVIVLGLGGTMAVLALTGEDNGGGKAKAPTLELPKGGGNGDQKNASKQRAPAAPPIDPSTVTVAVLNGTTVTGLAGTTGQKVVASGFRLGNVATASQQQRAESVVLYSPGSSRQARAVARKLGISQIEPVDAQSASLAGAANVIVVVGADKAHA